MNRLALFIVVLSLGTAGAFGAGGGEQGGKAAVVKPVEISVTWWGNDARHKKFNTIFDMYQQKHPNVTITRNYGVMADLFMKMATQAASGSMPDMPGMASQYIGNFADKGLLDDMRQYSGKGLDLSKFSKGAITAGTYKGVLYMITGGDTAQVLGFNKTMLERLGVAFPKSQMTWDEYVTYAKSVKAKLASTDSWAVMDETKSEHPFETFIRQYGYELTTADGTKVGYPKQVVQKWYQYWKDMREAGLVPPPKVIAENAGKAYQDTIQYKGKLMAFGQQLNQLKINQATLKDFELSGVRLPVAADGKYKSCELLQPSAFSIYKGSKVKPEAVKLLNWFVSDLEAQRVFNMEWGVPAVSDVRKMLLDNLKPDTDVIDRLKKLELNLMDEIGNTVIPHPGRQWGVPAILTDMGKKGEMVIFGMATPEQAAEAHIAAANQILAGK